MEVLGIDIGGTGIKGAPVDLATGRLTAERLRIATPDPVAPGPVTEVAGIAGAALATQRATGGER